MQNSRNVFTRLLYEILGPVYVLYLTIQHTDEGILYLVYSLYYLPYEKEETILHSKCYFLVRVFAYTNYFL